jgi:hypothetical protein
MCLWRDRLRDDLGISPAACDQLASAISREVLALSGEVKQQVRAASLIPLDARLEELKAFQGWMDLAHNFANDPVMVRAQVIAELYICFVYLGESCFKILRSELPAGSVARKCCKFLTDNPVRAFEECSSPFQLEISGRFLWIGVLGQKGRRSC